MQAYTWLATIIVACGWAIHATAMRRQKKILVTDPVTGLPVRASYLRQAPRLLRAGDAVQLILDLDDFKPINDVHGHPTGDRVLMAIADRLRDYFGGTALISRLGGDEFAVLIQLGPADGPWQESAAGVLPHLTAPIDVPGTPTLQVTASIGAVHLNRTRRPNLSAALRLADRCMYVAKRRRCGFVAYTAAPDEAVVTVAPPREPGTRPRDYPRRIAVPAQ